MDCSSPAKAHHPDRPTMTRLISRQRQFDTNVLVQKFVLTIKNGHFHRKTRTERSAPASTTAAATANRARSGTREMVFFDLASTFSITAAEKPCGAEKRCAPANRRWTHAISS
jgi:hypothetical protein